MDYLTAAPNIILAVATFVSSLAAFVQSFRNGKKAKQTKAKVDTLAATATDQAHQVTKLTETAKVIHDNTNGTLTEFRRDLAASNARVLQLEKLLSGLLEQSALARIWQQPALPPRPSALSEAELAAAFALSGTPHPHQPPPPPGPAPDRADESEG